jgi:hypothetical protein
MLRRWRVRVAIVLGFLIVGIGMHALASWQLLLLGHSHRGIALGRRELPRPKRKPGGGPAPGPIGESVAEQHGP